MAKLFLLKSVRIDKIQIEELSFYYFLLQMVEEREIFFRDYALQSIARNRKAD
jgi:hypothetical protein